VAAVKFRGFNRCLCCPVHTDVADCIGGTGHVACPLLSGQFGLAGMGRLAWRTPGAKKQTDTGWVH